MQLLGNLERVLTVANGVEHEVSFMERRGCQFDGLDDGSPLCGASTQVVDHPVLPALPFRWLAVENLQLVVLLLADDVL